jgi:predicted metalloprotease with PDZ domain
MVHGADQPLTEARILETAERYLALDSRVELKQIVSSGAQIAALDNALGPCAHASTEDLVSFDLGFDFDASAKANKVSGVRPDGPAFKAGLRDGQELLGSSVYYNDAEKPAKFTIQTGNGAKTKVEYFPRGKTVTVPQYHLDQECREKSVTEPRP